ncbi:hypothetical protein VCRA2119O147_330050 [Vibrio crassostreae]|uniref:Uncharacterized protein n=1 Tax=Vibrio crassostreae TaxID=246167 RepID=A0A822MMQ3_9VIBR|nr:hypothetical protein [Vibrio crassostreae]CAK1697481.1 hypothetical protein VCRA2113O414_100063 [Vibrio crassostreae]CAK1698726.1 hypothetical protein VCRA2113O418_100063 [Vibrio crassostreae]CAK1704107.1 hypothetical protein VCRA2118O429_100118 [Vibrio crassostreae]CAK1704171.1 hypothetical protein VCRA2114O421_100119 [Vibrio crassostreae]
MSGILKEALADTLENNKANSVSPVNQIVYNDFSITTSQKSLQNCVYDTT